MNEERSKSVEDLNATPVGTDVARSSWIYDILARPHHNGLRVAEACVFYGRGDPVEVASADVQGLRVGRGFFWHKLQLMRGEQGGVALAGLSKQQLRSAARSLHDRHLQPKVTATLDELGILIGGASYPRHSVVRAFLTRALPVQHEDLSGLEELLEPASMSDLRRVAELSHWSLDSVIAEVEKAKQLYVERELNQWRDFFDQVESNPLTQRQREAIVHDEDAVLVNAGAGTGKTSTIVAKVLYLIRRGLARPEQLLILAFNRKAREEIESRLKILSQQHGIDSEGVEVRTFHSLGRQILGWAQGEMPGLVEGAADEKQFGKRLESIMQALMQEDSTYTRSVIDWFAFHASPPPVDEGEDAVESMAAYNRYLREVETRSLSGHLVRSHEELLIANWLWLSSIDFDYEAKYEKNTSSPTRGPYRPDFSLYRTTKNGEQMRVYLEHFGIDKVGRTAPHIDPKEYLESMRWKREIHASNGTTLVETYSWMRRDGVLLDEVEKLVRAKGFEPMLRPTEEVFARLNELNRVSPFVMELVSRLLGLAKERGFRGSELDDRVESLAKQAARRRATAFLQVFRPIAERYEMENEDRREIDFADMILGASEAVEKGHWDRAWRFILVDEFQDISHGRARLVKALRSLDSECRLFCVGDDWQAINGFAGGAVEIMTEFKRHFNFAKIVSLDRTFRYGEGIGEKSAEFVQRDPVLMRKSMAGNPERKRSIVDVRTTEGKDQLAALVDLLRGIEGGKGDEGPLTVLVLGRYHRSLPEHTTRNRIASDFPELQIDWRTVHGSKGLEATEVIVLDVAADRMGFPCARADDPLLDLVRDQQTTISFAEERRLFYVALTRARERVTLLAPTSRPSRFIEELLQREKIPADGLTSERRRPCLECSDGVLVAKTSKKGHLFFSCSNSPACAYFSWPCRTCGIDVPDRTTRPPWVCNCGAKESPCPSCGEGLLVERNGSRGVFYGCTNYRGGQGCRFTSDRI